ncbi:hypothetical protein ABZ366_22245, partial [Streptomyces sp. NPDC005904]
MTTQTRITMPPPVRPARLIAPPGVYAPQYDTELLTRALHREGIGEGSSARNCANTATASASCGRS